MSALLTRVKTQLVRRNNENYASIAAGNDLYFRFVVIDMNRLKGFNSSNAIRTDDLFAKPVPIIRPLRAQRAQFVVIASRTVTHTAAITG